MNKKTLVKLMLTIRIRQNQMLIDGDMNEV